MDILIRPFEDKDLDEVIQIENVSVPIPWSKESYQNEIHNQWASYFVCERNGEIIGYSGVWHVFEEANITTIVVRKDCRREGIGLQLMDTMEKTVRNKNAERLMLEVRPSNTPALTLYYGLGFIQISRRKAYYPDNQEDALILCKYLNIDLSGAVMLGKQ